MKWNHTGSSSFQIKKNHRVTNIQKYQVVLRMEEVLKIAFNQSWGGLSVTYDSDAYLYSLTWVSTYTTSSVIGHKGTVKHLPDLPKLRPQRSPTNGNRPLCPTFSHVMNLNRRSIFVKKIYLKSSDLRSFNIKHPRWTAIGLQRIMTESWIGKIHQSQ